MIWRKHLYHIQLLPLLCKEQAVTDVVQPSANATQSLPDTNNNLPLPSTHLAGEFNYMIRPTLDQDDWNNNNNDNDNNDHADTIKNDCENYKLIRS